MESLVLGVHFRAADKADCGLRRVKMGFLAWIVVGGIAGWLAGQVMKGGGYGILVDIITWHPRRHCRWLDLWSIGNLDGWRHDRLHHCRVCWRGDFDLDYAVGEESLTHQE